MKVTYSAKANITHRTQQLEDGRSVEVISLTQAEHAQDAQLVLEWSFPILDIAGRWHPNCRFDRSIKADWSYGEKSMSAVSAPVISFFNEEGQNRGTFALSETLKEVRMSLGVHEEDGTMNCMVVVSLGALDSDCYELSLLCDDRNVRYEQAIREVGLWWEKIVVCTQHLFQSLQENQCIPSGIPIISSLRMRKLKQSAREQRSLVLAP